MDFKNLDMKEDFKELERLAPVQTAHLPKGDFPYRYFKNGNPEKDVTLLFLAGGTGMSDSMFPIYLCFMKKYSVISFNYPMAFPSNISLADAMAELLLQIGAENVYLAGQSYGGMIAQVMAKRHPKAIKGLILSATCSMYNDLTYDGITNITTLINPKKLEKNLRRDKRMPIKLMSLFMRHIFKKTLKDKDAYRMLTDILELTRGTLSKEYMYHMDILLGDLMNEFGTHKPQDFESFDNEVLLLFSETDHIFREDLKSALIRLMPNPKVVPDLKGGHLALLTDSNEYIGLLEDFIEKRN